MGLLYHFNQSTELEYIYIYIIYRLKHKVNFIFDACWSPSQSQILLQSFSEKHFQEMASACILHIGINLWVPK